eukprot:SM000050S17062  [mRNA]  locus=s50:765637:768014:- [translate_table: standard]
MRKAGVVAGAIYHLAGVGGSIGHSRCDNRVGLLGSSAGGSRASSLSTGGPRNGKGCSLVTSAGWLVIRGLVLANVGVPGSGTWQRLTTALWDSRGGPSAHSCASSQAPADGTLTYLRSSRTAAEVYLVGTAHISARSAQQVREVIRKVKPRTVMIELCDERLKKLMTHGNEGTSTGMDALGGWLQSLSGMMRGNLIEVALSSFYKLLASLGLEPGKEFKVAVEEAQLIGATVVCGDRRVSITLKRLQEAISLKEMLSLLARPPSSPGYHPRQETMERLLGLLQNKGKSFAEVLPELTELMKNREDVRVMRAVVEAASPGAARVMITERDEHMAEVVKGLQGTVVVVVGLAHMDGIEQRLQAGGYEK